MATKKTAKKDTKKKATKKPVSKVTKAARADASGDFNFSDAFDDAERASKLTAVEVQEKIDITTCIHSGSLVQDLVIYGGGFQAGRIYDLQGGESGGKSTSANIALVQAIKSIPGPLGKTKGILGDAEGTLDKNWFCNIAEMYGVDLSPTQIFGKKHQDGTWEVPPTIRLIKPTTGEPYLKMLIKVLNNLPDKVFINDAWHYSWTPVEAKVAKKTGGQTEKQLKEMLEKRKIQYDKNLLKQTGSFMVAVPDNYGGPELLIVTDSLIALTPQQTAEDDSAALAQHGRMFSKYINSIKSLAAAKGATLININQLRSNPGVRFGDPRYAPGGESIKYVSDCRNWLMPCANPAGGGMVEEDGDNVYRWTSMTNKKNKLYTPHKKIKFRWWTQKEGSLGCGLDPVYDTMQYLELTNQIADSGRKGFVINLQDKGKLAKALDGKKLDNVSFYNLIVHNQLEVDGKVVKADLRRTCLEQIRSGLAFRLYKDSAIPTEEEDTEE